MKDAYAHAERQPCFDAPSRFRFMPSEKMPYFQTLRHISSMLFDI